MTVAQETIRMTGIRCERCVDRLAVALRSHEGIESARANLVGDVTLAWDEERTSREEILATLAKAGFRELPAFAE
jgi:copper chaperone CopZ